MINIPFPVTGEDWESFRPTLMYIIRDLYENRIGGAMVGDVFKVGGDTLELKLATGSGLIKTNGELDIDVDTIGTNGAVMKVAYTAKGVILVGTAASTISSKVVGTNGDCLVADSSDLTGVAWKHPSAVNIIFTPAGGLAADDVQEAIEELDIEKAAKAQPYGCFSDSTDQAIATTSLAYAITYNTDETKSGITHSTVTNPSRVYVDNAGTYLITFSAVGKSAVANKELDIWLSVDGTNIARSNTLSRFVGAANERIITVTYIHTFTANQYFELYMHSNDTGTVLKATAAASTPTRPASPSIILTVNRISA